uniref:NADH-ubiquinone oxidoreductase chain 4 n=3 Tax=Bathymodiolus aduloides TaxID=268473 RepID=A0A8A2F3J7_9BIVA|nr:NADH dehydrogenase subunit 4 [Bathymodiolus aduloides]QSV10327.1 NADH dehydrogenase subunit 4 [Bathymodiolus aduloides]
MVLGLIMCMLLLGVLGSVEVSIAGLSLFGAMAVPLFLSAHCSELAGVFCLDFSGQALVVLSIYISFLMVGASATVSRFSSFNSLIICIGVLLVGAFSVSATFSFFILFEGVLFPTLLLIIGWGYQPERLQAVVYMVVYTVMGSLPLLYGLGSLYFNGGSDNLFSLEHFLDKSVLSFSWLYLLAFLVKLPVFPLHLWLPKAHVEAPVAGSMILAGLLLKLGGYGVIRLSALFVLKSISVVTMLVMMISLLGGVLTSMVCMRQTDFKSLVAYSSVGHMSFVLIGLLSNTLWGFMGAMLVMVGHGLCSSGLFAMVNTFYLSSHSRLLSMNKGYLMVSPCASLLCFLLSVSNMASPPSLNLLGELFIYMVGASMNLFFLPPLMLLSFLSACYSLYIYVSSQHGKCVSSLSSRGSFSMADLLVLSFHWMPLNFMFVVIP